MKKLISLSTIAFALIFTACTNSSTKNEKINSPDTIRTPTVAPAQQFNFDTATLKAGEAFYQCPMDLEVISNQPGSCPKCGMALETMVKK